MATAQGYATGQFGKNYLGDLNKFLPTVHGFDEFFGYLYHLDAMSDPYWYSYPRDWVNKYGPRDLVHSYASNEDDPTEQPRWGKIGKQKIIDEFWRFVVVQKTVSELAKSAIEFPPMQAPATFNLDAVKRQVEEAIKAREGQ